MGLTDHFYSQKLFALPSVCSQRVVCGRGPLFPYPTLTLYRPGHASIQYAQKHDTVYVQPSLHPPSPSDTTPKNYSIILPLVPPCPKQHPSFLALAGRLGNPDYRRMYERTPLFASLLPYEGLLRLSHLQSLLANSYEALARCA